MKRPALERWPGKPYTPRKEVVMRFNNLTTGQPMAVDPRHPPFPAPADSVKSAIEYQRRHRVEFLEVMLLRGDMAGFDANFLRFFAEDDAIVVLLSEKGAERARIAMMPREVQ
jgi:hypothetical protein